jgi:hypothetical protein
VILVLSLGQIEYDLDIENREKPNRRKLAHAFILGVRKRHLGKSPFMPRAAISVVTSLYLINADADDEYQIASILTLKHAPSTLRTSDHTPPF